MSEFFVLISVCDEPTVEEKVLDIHTAAVEDLIMKEMAWRLHIEQGLSYLAHLQKPVIWNILVSSVQQLYPSMWG